MAAAGAGLSTQGALAAIAPSTSEAPAATDATEPFWGEHQGGILTPLQRNTYFAAFDLIATERDDVIKMLQAWTAAAARYGQAARPRNRSARMTPFPRPTAARPWVCRPRD